jgi:hypothetical protein
MWHVTCWLVSDVWRVPRRATSSGHDVAGPGPGPDKDLQEVELRRVAQS